MSKRKLSAKRIVADIKEDMLNWDLMQKYQLTYPQLVLLFAGLTEKRLIKHGIMTNAVDALLEVGSLASAKSVYTILQRRYPNIRGMKALGQRLESAEALQTAMIDYHRRLARPCRALETFAVEYPGITLHPEISRLIWMYELSIEEILHTTINDFQPLVTISSRLKLVADNASMFMGLPPIQANRMWHLLALKMFADNGVGTFILFRPKYAFSCGVCTCVAFQDFSVKDVLTRMNRAMAKGNLVPNRPFPFFNEIQLMPPEEIKSFILRRGWCLPPFCNECRCQILPSLF
ncbi:MAG: hypothetical protein ACLQPD_26915 [Desulfomonilaceae bacterium]